MSSRQLGILFAIVGSLMFSTKAVFVKLAYQYPVDTISLLTIRMLTALPIYVLIFILGRKAIGQPERIDWLLMTTAAFLGYYVASFLDFWGLQFVDASVERLILFTYPTFIVIILYFFGNEKITTKIGSGLILSYIGLVWVFSPKLGTVSMSDGFWLGAVAILCCAIAFACYMVFSQKLIPKFGSARYTGIVMIFACSFVIAHYLLTQPIAQIQSLHPNVYVFGICMGIIATVIPSYLINFAVQRIGASQTAIIASIGPLSTITLAYLFLGERLSWQQWIGAVFIIWSVTVISVERKKK